MIVSPYIPSSPCGIAIIGEAPGEEEEKTGMPFMGSAGQELTRILADAGINRYSCHITNVFNERPPKNDLDAWCTGALEARRLNGGTYPWNPISRGKYILAEKLSPSLARLKQDLSSWQPRLVLALGNVALFALTGSAGISSVRGVVQPCSLVPGLKLLPTYHPAYILRQWSDRAIMVADLMKGVKELAYPEIRRPRREVWIEPTLEDLEAFSQHMLCAQLISVDIETAHGQITCIGFAPSRALALTVPLVDRRKPNYSYWTSAEEEYTAVSVVRSWLKLPNPKVFQNGMYDIQWIWRKLGIAPRNCLHDTMLKHHAIQPELQKGLGFLGSLYTQESSWKLMREEAKDTIKRDE